MKPRQSSSSSSNWPWSPSSSSSSSWPCHQSSSSLSLVVFLIFVLVLVVFLDCSVVAYKVNYTQPFQYHNHQQQPFGYNSVLKVHLNPVSGNRQRIDYGKVYKSPRTVQPPSPAQKQHQKPVNGNSLYDTIPALFRNYKRSSMFIGGNRGGIDYGKQAGSAAEMTPILIGTAVDRRTEDLKRSRPYDVPQIECPLADDGMERFACPSPDSVGRYRCVDDHVLCDGFIDCPNAEDEDRQACMFYKTTKAHLDVLADALLRWARG